MERGYLKVWRKIEDSQSYNRSALHRAILLTIFVKANWKGGFFCGRAVAPGQIATSIKSLAEELREPRTTVQRALRDIEKDGVINLENVGNRWTMITLVNWGAYQSQDEKHGQPSDNHRLTSGYPVGTIKEGKKERIKEYTNTQDSLENEDSARVEACAADINPAGTVPTEPSIDFQELRQFWDEHFRPEAPLAGFTEYKQLRAAKAYPGDSRIYEDLKARIDCQFWDQGFAPGLAKYLRERAWLRPPSATSRASPVAQKSWLEREDEANFNAFMAEAKAKQEARERGVV